MGRVVAMKYLVLHLLACLCCPNPSVGQCVPWGGLSCYHTDGAGIPGNSQVLSNWSSCALSMSCDRVNKRVLSSCNKELVNNPDVMEIVDEVGNLFFSNSSITINFIPALLLGQRDHTFPNDNTPKKISVYQHGKADCMSNNGANVWIKPLLKGTICCLKFESTPFTIGSTLLGYRCY